ncbi:hypothetical protein ANCCAN_25022 [Ancylostoma caninum]|uniref:Uncharacterized protein n=1 Tax=Ancylostoma caninum TaxID=29170 RepID=A0A368FEI7_ANCCA|nr:hypothetical protein ANCCAN_25022 [Ancylostoma caninum]
MKTFSSPAWPLYLRPEGLPFHEKNEYENIILAGLMFLRKTPTEKLLIELFSRFKHVLFSKNLAFISSSETALGNVSQKFVTES